jgi:transposase
MTRNSKNRRSAAVKEEAVLRLLRGEPPDAVSRDTGFPLHQLSAWRLAYTSAGRDALKVNRSARHDSQLALAQRLIAKLALEVEILKKAKALKEGHKP